ncbi:MAG: hypothetical protein PHV18_04425 [Lachnospiraceae bacterium]|nr:hypothetical protein [Lachnospiraceae bacterium]
MKLNDLYSKPLEEVLQEFDIVDVKVHADESGIVKSIELKYGEKQKQPQTKTNPYQ